MYRSTADRIRSLGVRLVDKLVHPLTVLTLVLGLMVTAGGVLAAHFQATTRISLLESRVEEIRGSITSLSTKLDTQSLSNQALALRMERLDASIEALVNQLERDRRIRGYTR